MIVWLVSSTENASKDCIDDVQQDMSELLREKDQPRTMHMHV
jgi:hypothetical protein